MKDRLTHFGIKCREFRARYNLTMGDQAQGLGVSPAYVSAIERGKRPIPEDYPQKLCVWMSLSEEDSNALNELASGERTVVKVFPKDREKALLAKDFASGLNGLRPEAVKQLRQLFRDQAKSTKYSDDEIVRRAYLARAVFNLGEQLSFDILRVIENQLALIDPDFSLQVDPDGSLGELVQVYSESDGKKINRFVSTEWLYKAAHRGTDDSRFKLAHELAHWILHRTETHTFLRSPRTNKNLSKVYARVEREADFFAREFLMPLTAVEKCDSAEALAKAAQVPLGLARYRLREMRSLTVARRATIRKIAEDVGRSTREIEHAVASVLTTSDSPATAVMPTADILQFPKIGVFRRAATAKRKAPASLPLFDYADMRETNKHNARVNRSDQWFADFGWRG